MKFKIHALSREGTAVTLVYDNAESTLLWGDGTEVVQPVAKSWGDVTAISREEPGEKRNIRVLKISLGLSCNFSCSYCSQRFVPHAPSQHSLEKMHTFVTRLPEWFDIKGADGSGGGRRVEFWGGEPLVYVKLLQPLAEALRAMMPTAQFVMITNGSLLRPEINEWIDSLGFQVGISHDGPGQATRGPDPLADPASLHGIMDLYNRLHPTHRISINTMMHKDNTSRAAVQAYMQAVFGDDVRIGEGSYVDPYDEGGVASMLPNYASYTRLAYEDIRSGRASRMNIVSSKISDFIDSLVQRRPASAVGQKCGMDRQDNLATTLAGEVITCQNVSPVSNAPNGESHKIGSVYDLANIKLRTATHWSKRPDCASCPVLQLCKGACMFLEGDLWSAACDASYADNVPFFAAAIEALTGCTPLRIEGAKEGRVDLWQ